MPYMSHIQRCRASIAMKKRKTEKAPWLISQRPWVSYITVLLYRSCQKKKQYIYTYLYLSQILPWSSPTTDYKKINPPVILLMSLSSSLYYTLYYSPYFADRWDLLSCCKIKENRLSFKMETVGVEPMTSWMPFKRSPNWATPPCTK